ncbi:MAG TPA: hypothetical protein VFY78_04150, partial [Gammaproteobacteria bacterium]|nr:hypothetical protein [Gammaproteobacteria bacterium]
IDSEANDSASVLVENDYNPMTLQHNGFAAEEINTPKGYLSCGQALSAMKGPGCRDQVGSAWRVFVGQCPYQYSVRMRY